ncbi:unnamed protein product [Phytophthora fragariaefolia]|uniref:Unnamed protein product n=1 Tax=Phytophthora fragariaefolia TaxID=1490495 RepID=A0A9W6XWJ8_9STRA|nr:unnamed protein product [Phytophthora fragariaefolia]
MGEFQILMVASWGDFAMRILFAWGLITNMNNMKRLLDTSSSSLSKNFRSTKSIVPLTPNLSGVSFAIHLHAESMPSFPQCELPIRPWFSSQPSCSLLLLNCHVLGLSGLNHEVVANLGTFDLTTVTFLVIRHCPILEIPTKLIEFSRLRALKVYNSTITSWQEDATISQSHHPNLLMLFLVRVNLSNGELPTALYRNTLPQGLRDIEFCFTNLRSLPEDLDLTWPQFATIYLEAGNLTEIPLSLVRLASFDLSLALNPIATVPAAILENNAGYLHIGGTLISGLPEDVEAVSPEFKIRVDNTKVSFFWNWTGPMVANANGGYGDGIPTILASNSPYCSDLQRIYDGELTRFSAPQQEGQSLVLSDASMANWPILQKTVSCELWPAMYYPIESEDEHSGLKYNYDIIGTIMRISMQRAIAVSATSFGVKPAAFEKMIVHFLEILSPYLYELYVEDTAITDSMKKVVQGGHAFPHYPAARYAVGVTFHESTVKSGSQKERAVFYSAKHKLHGYKTELSVIPTGIAINCSMHYRGSVADITIFRDNKAFHEAATTKLTLEETLSDDGPHHETYPSAWIILADKSYQGLADTHRVVHPKRRCPIAPLMLKEETTNRNISSDLSIVENYFGRLCTLWALCSDKYRWKEARYEMYFRACVALTNVHV